MHKGLGFVTVAASMALGAGPLSRKGPRPRRS